MLGLRSVGQLAAVLKMPPRSVFKLADRVPHLVREFDLVDPSRPDRRSRIVVSPQGELRKTQRRLHLLMCDRLPPTPYSFGGVRGKNAKRNAVRHRRSTFAYTTDITDFFPSIRQSRIESLLVGRLDCEAETARLIARLCTHQGKLAQGLITSPILASECVRRVDARIGGLCKQHALRYTRFVDDITISGEMDLEADACKLTALVECILAESGFKTASHKMQVGRIDQGKVVVTGLRVVGGHLDVEEAYFDRLKHNLTRHRAYAAGDQLCGHLCTQDQLEGRLSYVRHINRRRAGQLALIAQRIDWNAVMNRARDKGIVAERKHLRERNGGSENSPQTPGVLGC